MSRFVFKLPDLGEGTVEAEIVAWRVKPGDPVEEDQVLVEVMTEKAAVEVPAPVSGTVLSISGQPGDTVAVGAELIVLESAPAAGEPAVDAPGSPGPSTSAPGQRRSGPSAPTPRPADGNGSAPPVPRAVPVTARGSGKAPRTLTSPAIRRKAREAGIDLALVQGTGPHGRIGRHDFEAYAAARAQPSAAAAAQVPSPRPCAGTEEIKVIGLRRLVAQRMAEAKRNIPHFSYIEEVDVTELESLRRHLNTRLEAGAPSLTYLPFLALALVRVLEEFPQCNAHYDSERGVIVRHRAVHLGVATQTADGLKVPVVRDVQLRSLADLAAEMRRVTAAARSNTARREELGGSTITVTSLGKLGGIASTPIINAPEVSIVGVNRALERPVVLEGAIAVRRMMNLSSSFDHRFVDGHDAAAMIQALKERLEHPAMIFAPR